jgi:hypothetical protein
LADLKVIESTHRVSDAPALLREDCCGRCSRKYRRNRRALRARVLFDAASAPGPTGASGKPAATATDNLFNIEFNGWSGVEAFLDFRLQPGELLAATLLMRDWRDDGGFATAIRPLAYLRGYEFLKGGWQFYGVGRHGRSSIGDTLASSNQKIGTVAKA